MTPKQISALEHIHMNGNDDLTHISGVVLNACYKRGWIVLDMKAKCKVSLLEFSKLRVNQLPFILTDEGRQALHDATR